MNKIHLIMPMAGGGTRFLECGFKRPKPIIEIRKRPFFYWAVESINHFIDVQDIIFVVLEEHIRNFEIDKLIRGNRHSQGAWARRTLWGWKDAGLMHW